MATCLDYAKIAFAAYFDEVGPYYADPPGHMVDDWTVTKWSKGVMFGDGFQGGIYQSDKDMIVGCCGTNLKQTGKAVKDLLNDLSIVVRIAPPQIDATQKMVRLAKSLANGRRVSITGHSLGGGLSQLAGLREEVPFVTFNAPAMARVAAPFAARSGRPGLLAKGGGGVNFRIRGLSLDGRVRDDRVSMHSIAGGHLGMVVDLAAASSTGSHGKDTCWQAVLATDWSDVDPFEALSRA